MKKSTSPMFFPRERQFWQLHGGGMLLIVVTQLLSALMWGHSLFNDAVATAIWVLPYTLSVLIFRYSFLKRGWAGIEVGRLVWLSLTYATVVGMLIAVFVFAATFPLVWGDIVAAHTGDAQWQPMTFAAKVVVGNGLSNQLFVGAWIFIFASAVASQRARDAELINLRLQNSLKEAQLSTLANQLNAHFLFNALNNIRFLIHEDGRAADEMMTSLSALLRYSLESSNCEKVTLCEELEMVERYLAIVKIQMEHRLIANLTVPVSLRGYLVPPMVLQLLVENSIKHGLEGLPRGGELVIVVRESEGLLNIFVGNDAPTVADTKSLGMGIGLQNIRRRLQLLYGEAARICVVHDVDHGLFEVELTLPKEVSQ